MAEPGDAEAAALVEALGPEDALAWVEQAQRSPHRAKRTLASFSDRPDFIEKLLAASARWYKRWRLVPPHEHLRMVGVLGGRCVTRDDHEWPAALTALGSLAPFALWVRSARPLNEAWGELSVALVGARAATAYGTHVAGMLGSASALDGISVVSGGAYGIDAAAHRGALAAGGSTIAVMAGGVDRLYPAGNAELLARIIEGGAVLSEVPPGYPPHKSRFLWRNRLIACASATVVVEAAYRSGSLSTARHAIAMGRPVGAVPGPITSASSQGCHRLIREEFVTCVSSPTELVELVSPLTRESN